MQVKISRHLNRRRQVIRLFVAALVVGGAVYFGRQFWLNGQLLAALGSQQPVSVVQGLLQQGANPSAQDIRFGTCPLSLAVSNGSLESVDVLLAAGASPSLVESQKPLFTLSLRNLSGTNDLTVAQNRAIIQALQNKGENIEERDVLGLTPLMRAVWAGNLNAVRALLAQGADSRVRNVSNQSVRDLMCLDPMHYDEIMVVLRQHDLSNASEVLAEPNMFFSVNSLTEPAKTSAKTYDALLRKACCEEKIEITSNNQ